MTGRVQSTCQASALCYVYLFKKLRMGSRAGKYDCAITL